MLKLTIAAAALAAAGTTVYVAYPSSDASSTPAAIAAAPAATVVATPTATPPRGGKIPAAPATSPTAAAPRGGGDEGDGDGDGDAKPCGGSCDHKHVVDDGPQAISRDTIARLGLEKGPARGAANAPVTIVAFTDTKCHFCNAALGTVDQLLEEYDGKVRVVVKQRPVIANSAPLSAALYAAEEQGKYWALHDVMSAHQDELSQDSVLSFARQAGLDVGKFSRALAQGPAKARVDADAAAADELAIKGVPAFFVNGQPLVGNRSIADFRALIDRALAR